MLIEDGYRLGIGIILTNSEGYVFWARRIGHDAWQFPQGGINEGETPLDALYRELYEEVGLEPDDVEVLGAIENWLYYSLPKPLLRQGHKGSVMGQKQKWFLLRLVASEQKIRLDLTRTPEFDSWCWVNYWHPAEQVVDFKREVYRLALRELEPLLSCDRK